MRTGTIGSGTRRERIQSAPSFEEFFEQEYERLVRMMFLLARDHHEAEDLAEEAMARTFERWERVCQMEAPAAYVYRIAVNLHRRRHRRVVQLMRDVLPRLRSPEEDIPDAETRTEVRMALRSLNSELRTVLVLTEWLGMTSEEVGSVVGLRPSSVRSRLLKARAAFRETMAGSDD